METQQLCQQAFNNLQNEYVLLAHMLHYYDEGKSLPKEEAEVEKEEESVSYDVTYLLSQLDEFKIRYYQYAGKVMAIEKEHNNLQLMQDKLDATFDDFDDSYFSPIVRDYKNAQIDIVALDK